MRARWMATLTAAVAVSVAAGVSGAVASPTTPQGADVVKITGVGKPSLTDAELFDIQQVANDKGIDVDQAIAELASQDDFTAFVTEVSERFPDDFAYARYDEGRATLGVKSGLTNQVAALASKLPMNLEVTQHVGWSEKEIRAAGEALHAAVRSASDGAEVHTDIDSEAGQVTVSVESQPAPGAQASGRLADNTGVAQAAARVPAGVPVSIDAGAALSGGLDTVYGGGHLSTCTAAFSVRSSSYANGLLTAEHYGNTQAYEGRSVLTFRAALAKSSGDAQWHSSSETAAPSFYYTNGSRRAITSTANAVPGQSLCKYGKTTSNTCDEVYKTGQCRGDYCNLIMTHRRKADSGDSGGPWFWGNAGYGIHSGWKTYLLINRDMFTPVRSTATGLGLTVKLQ